QMWTPITGFEWRGEVTVRTLVRLAAMAGSSRIERPTPGLAGEGAEAPAGRGRIVDDLCPRETAAEPAGGGDDRRLTPGVVDGLTLVMLSVELDEQPETGPGEVDTGDELAVAVMHLDLAIWHRHLGDGAGQLHHQCLEQALRR